MTDESHPIQTPAPAPAPEPALDTAAEAARRHAPPGRCTLCWRDELVWRDGGWWAEHIGSLDECTHSCHAEAGFLESTS